MPIETHKFYRDNKHWISIDEKENVIKHDVRLHVVKSSSWFAKMLLSKF